MKLPVIKCAFHFESDFNIPQKTTFIMKIYDFENQEIV